MQAPQPAHCMLPEAIALKRRQPQHRAPRPPSWESAGDSSPEPLQGLVLSRQAALPEIASVQLSLSSKPYQGHSGPKSGGRSSLIHAVGFITLNATVGARVSAGAVPEERLNSLLLGKQNGLGHPGGRHHSQLHITHHHKTAYKRACNRLAADGTPARP